MGVKDTANLAMIPAAYAEDKVYSVVPSDGDGDFTFTRTGLGTRINKGGYIETMAENVPRLNYRLDADGNPKGCPELLLEESRINYISRSEEFNLWGDVGVTVTPNATIAPDGTQTADKLVSNANNWRKSQSFSGSSGTTYSVSVFVKLDTSTSTTTTQIEIFKGASGLVCDFNLYNETIAENTGLNDPFIEKYPNGWFRIGGTYTANGTTQIMYVYPSSGYSVSGTMFFWGAQVEAGSTVSSYIPTGASPITRNRDSATLTPFVDMASDYPITVYWKGRITNLNGNNTGFSIYQNGYGSRYLMLTFNSSSQLLLRRRDSGGEDLDYISYTTQIGDIKKIAIKFTSNTSAKVYVDGLEVLNLSGGTDIDYSYDCVNIGTRSIAGDTNLRNPADELFVWNKALTDAEMVDVTSYNAFAEMATGQQYTIQ
jgi:hypothetical protein